MQRSQSISSWAPFRIVLQDVGGSVMTEGASLFTRGLSNCLGIAMTNGAGTTGLIHVSPGHDQQASWIRALIEAVQPTHCVMTGASGGRDAKGLNALHQVFDDSSFTIIDETRLGWIPDPLGACTVQRGVQAGPTGVLAINGRLNQYFIGVDEVIPEADQLRSVAAKRRGRGGRRGNCIIF